MWKHTVRHVSNIKYHSLIEHCLLRTQLHGINKKQRLTLTGELSKTRCNSSSGGKEAKGMLINCVRMVREQPKKQQTLTIV